MRPKSSAFFLTRSLNYEPASFAMRHKLMCEALQLAHMYAEPRHDYDHTYKSSETINNVSDAYSLIFERACLPCATQTSHLLRIDIEGPSKNLMNTKIKKK